MKVLLSSLAVAAVLVGTGYVVAPVFADTSSPVCTLLSHPAGCVPPAPIWANAGGDGPVPCEVALHNCPSSKPN